MSKRTYAILGGILVLLVISIGISSRNTAPPEGSGEVTNTMPALENGAAPDEMIVEDDLSAVSTPTDVPASVKEFTLDSFDFGYSIKEIRVTEGDTVTINLTNSDGFHDWVVDEFGAATEKIQVGGQTSVTFVADTAGSYEYYCSVGSHRANGMVGTLVVEPKA